MEIPFEVYPKGPFDVLVDNLFSLLSCLTTAQDLLKSQAGNAEPLRIKLNTLVLGLITQLHNWWAQCTAMVNLGGLNAQAPMNAAKDDSDSQALDPDHFPILHHSDMPTAALAALYDAANIIALRLLPLVSPSAYLYEERIQRHARSIQLAKSFVEKIPGPTSNRGSTMVGFPYQILCIWGPFTTDGHYPGANKKQLFSNVAAYVLQHQDSGCIRQISDDRSLEDSVCSSYQNNNMSLELDRARLACT